MTAPDVRTAAQAEAEQLYPLLQDLGDPAISKSRRLRQKAFIKGAVWGAALVTPTREQLIEVLSKHQHDYCEECRESYGCTCGWKHPGAGALDTGEDEPITSISEHQTDAVLALMRKRRESG